MANVHDYETLWQSRSLSPAPDTTVIVSLFNYETLISTCLDSVAQQTLRKLDLIVVDDCSSDESAGAATRWLQQHGDRFQSALLVRHHVNRGLADTRNLAFALSRTEFVFVLDADNAIFPRCLEALRSALTCSSASFAYCSLEKFGEVTALLGTKPWNPASLASGNMIDAMALHRKSVWAKVGGYSSDMPAMGWEDFDLWFKIAKIDGWGILVPEILARYRVHSKSMLHVLTNPNADKLWAYLRSRHTEYFT